MNLNQLKWTKNVKPQKSENWAYPAEDIHPELKIFPLYWKNSEHRDEGNADAPKEGELILLRQHGKVTHLVELVNNRLYFNKDAGDEFNIYRLVQVVWMVDDWDKAPNNSEVFDCNFKFPNNGKVIKLENTKHFRTRWSKEGLEKFQEHIQRVLQLSFTFDKSTDFPLKKQNMVVGTFNGQNLYYVRTEGIGDNALDIVTIGQYSDETFLQGLYKWIHDASQLIIDENALYKVRICS
jgi:hypothetical protein